MRYVAVSSKSRNNLAIIRQLVRSNLEQKKEENEVSYKVHAMAAMIYGMATMSTPLLSLQVSVV